MTVIPFFFQNYRIWRIFYPQICGRGREFPWESVPGEQTRKLQNFSTSAEWWGKKSERSWKIMDSITRWRQRGKRMIENLMPSEFKSLLLKFKRSSTISPASRFVPLQGRKALIKSSFGWWCMRASVSSLTSWGSFQPHQPKDRRLAIGELCLPHFTLHLAFKLAWLQSHWFLCGGCGGTNYQ